MATNPNLNAAHVNGSVFSASLTPALHALKAKAPAKVMKKPIKGRKKRCQHLQNDFNMRIFVCGKTVFYLRILFFRFWRFLHIHDLNVMVRDSLSKNFFCIVCGHAACLLFGH